MPQHHTTHASHIDSKRQPDRIELPLTKRHAQLQRAIKVGWVHLCAMSLPPSMQPPYRARAVARPRRLHSAEGRPIL
jgi:hypothetical protein